MTKCRFKSSLSNVSDEFGILTEHHRKRLLLQSVCACALSHGGVARLHKHGERVGVPRVCSASRGL